MDFIQQLQIYTKRINKTLRYFIELQPFQETLLLQAMKYGILSGGKRLRPLIIYATGNMFGIDNNTLDVLAAVVECIHSYSLIHDDLPAMDNSILRRGLPSCHVKYGEANAILAGDALQTLAFFILSNAPMKDISDKSRLSIISELTKAIGIKGMCSGQALDLQTKEGNLTLKDLEFIYRYKTGSLIRFSVRVCAIINENQHSRCILTLLDNYADYIGLAFQIQDDILDAIGNTITLGKNQGMDKKFKKITYLSLLGLDSAKKKAKILINHAYEVLEKLALYSFDTSLLEILTNYIIQRDK